MTVKIYHFDNKNKTYINVQYIRRRISSIEIVINDGYETYSIFKSVDTIDKLEVTL